MLRVERLTIRAGTRDLVRDLSLDLAPDRITALIGPSGCGKTSVLRWLAGVLPADLPATGTLTVNDRRAITYQPQSDALFPWLTIAENAALGLRVRGLPVDRVAPLFAPFGLAGCENLFPGQLSGGMRQRAAFLRTMVQDGRYLLLDEPFSALDAVTRLQMQGWFLDRLAAEPRGVLLVTHDLHEATALADRILVMAANPGRIVADLPVTGPRTEEALAPLRTTLKSLLTKDMPCSAP